jgi:hypothetical protein
VPENISDNTLHEEEEKEREIPRELERETPV